MNKNLGEKMTKKWSKKMIKGAREIAKKHLVNSDPKLFTDKTISEILTYVELAEAKKLKGRA